MEYLLFVAGAFIIVLSLILTFRAKDNRDDYYFENEVLAEIRALKKEINKGEVKQEDFSSLLNKKVSKQGIIDEVLEVKKSLGVLARKNEEVLRKLNSLEEKVEKKSSFETKLFNKKSRESSQSNKASEEYYKIKELLEDGLSLPEVAKSLDMGTREVELICKLNSRRGG
ncbi:DUF6115 domain-containing protein [Halonatronum saccharophilum]|uniref:DUF6115 domain-containing protein n=1 Tax=Halonatronum saccharophilum TaxID=150060 RepID=UPI00048751D4|nr:hypothetical protein [Halonatronum saccharophilum]